MKLRLKQARLAKYLTQAELAERAGVSRATVAKLEAGQDARLKTIRSLADVLGITPDELVIKEDSEEDRLAA